MGGCPPTRVSTCDCKGLPSDDHHRTAPGAAPAAETQPDADLKAVIAAWPTLPAAIRAAIIGLATAVGRQAGGTNRLDQTTLDRCRRF